MKHVDVLVVGGGLSGLTAASYLLREGLKVCLCEQGKSLGGLLSGYHYEDYYFDSGVRSLLNAGLLKPMIKELGLEVKLLKSDVSLGVGNKWMSFQGESSLDDYVLLLEGYFPKEKKNLKAMKKAIKSVCKRMEVLYGTDNPLFVEKKDSSYLLKELLPWLMKYKKSMKAMAKEDQEVRAFLSRYTKNEALLDMVTQHFFKGVPASFALGYFYLYGDYYYPEGGTLSLITAFESYLMSQRIDLLKEHRVMVIDAPKREALTSQGEWISYSKLIWACDEVSLYRDVLPRRKDYEERLKVLKEAKATESVFSLNLGLSMEAEILPMKAHHFLTPSLEGLHTLAPLEGKSLEERKAYLKEYLHKTTFELSVPSLRDPFIHPKGHTSLQVSTIVDYSFFKEAELDGQADELKKVGEEVILDILEERFYPHLRSHVTSVHVSTPLTYEKKTLNHQGAISGWSFDQELIPSLTSVRDMRKATKTLIPHVYQAGQWTFSPAGIPVAIITGKLAAMDVLKDLGF